MGLDDEIKKEMDRRLNEILGILDETSSGPFAERLKQATDKLHPELDEEAWQQFKGRGWSRTIPLDRQPPEDTEPTSPWAIPFKPE